MKPTLIASAISLLFGFAGGWMMKSTTAELDSFTPERPQPVTQRPAPTPPRTGPIPESIPELPELSPDPQLPPPVPNAGAAEVAVPETVEQMDRVKWLRLIEVLGLNTEQSKALEARIEQARPNLDSSGATAEAYAKAGARLEADITAILTPEQQEAYKELKARDQGNRVEAMAQENYLTELGSLDLTPVQREQTLEILRAKAEQELAVIPENSRLFTSGSFMPLGGEGISDQGLILLSKLNTTPGGAGAQANFQDLAAIQREEIGNRMNQFEGILTPAQLARYQLGLQESLGNLDFIEQR